MSESLRPDPSTFKSNSGSEDDPGFEVRGPRERGCPGLHRQQLSQASSCAQSADSGKKTRKKKTQNQKTKKRTKALQVLFSRGMCGVCQGERVRWGKSAFLGGPAPPGAVLCSSALQSIPPPDFGQRQGLWEQRNPWFPKASTILIRGENQRRQIGRDPKTKEGLWLASRNRIRNGSENWDSSWVSRQKGPTQFERRESETPERWGTPPPTWHLPPHPPDITFWPKIPIALLGDLGLCPDPATPAWRTLLHCLPESWPRGWVSQQLTKLAVSESVYGCRTWDLKDNTIYVGYICEHLPC